MGVRLGCVLLWLRRLLCVLGRLCLLGWRLLRGCTLNYLVEFPPVEPNAAAIWTVIDLNPLAFGHDKVNGSADWTFHNRFLLSLADFNRSVLRLNGGQLLPGDVAPKRSLLPPVPA
jgi:hypothetical protein